MDHVEVLQELRIVLDWINRLPVPTGGAAAQGIRLADAIAALSANPEGEALGYQQIFNAIAAATKAHGYAAPYAKNGVAVEVSVKAFLAEIGGPIYTHPPRSHGVVVDEAMVDRFCEVYSETVPEDCLGIVRRRAIRAALVAALGEWES